MINFLSETLADIKRVGKTPGEVFWVGCSDGESAMSWSEFSVAANFKYNNGYGGNEISLSLVVVFLDGTWLARFEYDGSEEWRYLKLPTLSAGCKDMTAEQLREPI